MLRREPQFDGPRGRLEQGELSTVHELAMEMPPVYLHSRVLRGEADFDSRYRRDAIHDDHGETYPMTNEGPSLYYSLSIPSGTYCLSFYANGGRDGRKQAESPAHRCQHGTSKP